jgi:multicomponent K+:H+ antiporter subunit D
MSYLDDTANYLDRPEAYIDAVISQNPVRAVTPEEQR